MFEGPQIHGFKISHHVNNGFMEYGGLSESNVSSFSIDFQFLQLGKKEKKGCSAAPLITTSTITKEICQKKEGMKENPQN